MITRPTEKPISYHPVQFFLHLTYAWTISTSSMTAFGIYNLPMPYKTALEVAMPAMNLQSANVSYHLISQERPLDFFRQIGGSSAWKGFGRELAKFATNLVPPLVVGYGLGQVLWHLGDAMAASSSPPLQTLNFVLQTPLIREPLVGVVSLALYLPIKAWLERRFPTPTIPSAMMPTTDDARLMSIQHLVALLWLRPYTAFTMIKILHESLLQCRQDAVVHHPQFIALNVLFDQFMQAWFYFAFMPKPFYSQVPRDQWHRPNVSLDELVSLERGDVVVVDAMDEAEEMAAPSCEDLAKTSVFYSVRTAAVAVCALGVNSLLSLFQSDKEELDSKAYLAYFFAIYLVYMLTERLLQEGMARFSPRLFEFRHRHAGQVGRGPTIEDVTTENTLLLSQ